MTDLLDLASLPVEMHEVVILLLLMPLGALVMAVFRTLVVMCIVFVVSLLDYLELTPSAQAVVLPMVILTMTIERLYLSAEEDGLRFSLQLLAGTLLVGVCCYLVLRWEEVGRLLLAYPEIHFFTVAVLVLLGRYTGYRLTELWRFRDLASTEPDGS